MDRFCPCGFEREPTLDETFEDLEMEAEEK